MRNSKEVYKPIATILANDIYCPNCMELSNSAENAQSILDNGICLACKKEIAEDHVMADVLDQQRQEAMEAEEFNFSDER